MANTDRYIKIGVNGVSYTIENIDPKTSLNDWLRAQPGLKGKCLGFAIISLIIIEKQTMEK